MRFGWGTATHYVNDFVDYTEPLFVVVIMALASTRPIVALAERALGQVAHLGGNSPAAWWLAILTLAPLLGSLITEPAAMTIAALLLGRQFYDRNPGPALKYATLGLLFVNVSIGGTLTHFAAPPVLMVARHWGWDTAFMLTHFGWRAVVAVVVSNLAYFLIFGRELRAMAARPPQPDIDRGEENIDGAAVLPLSPIPAWVTSAHLLFVLWTILTAHYPPLFLGGFLFFLGFARATRHLSVADRPPGAAARRLLPRRPGHPWRPASLVDRAGAVEPLRTRLCISPPPCSPRSTTTR